VVSIEHADFDGIERIAAVTGGEIASTFDRPELVALGECALIDEIMVRACTQLDPPKHVLASLPGRPWEFPGYSSPPSISCRHPAHVLASLSQAALGGALYRRHPTLHVSDHASDVSLAPLSLPLSCCVMCAGGRGPADPVQRVQERQRLLHHPSRRILAPPRRGRYALVPSI